MEESTSKEKILKKVRLALIEESEIPFPTVNLKKNIFYDLEDEKTLVFAQKLISNGGNFVFCENQMEFVDSFKELFKQKKWRKVFTGEHNISSILLQSNIEISSNLLDEEKNTVSITSCEALIARFGSVLVSSKQLSGRKAIAFADTHVVIARTSQMVNEIENGLQLINEKYEIDKLPSMISMISGPSRTADIEKTLVIGAHGPKELYVFLIDE